MKTLANVVAFLCLLIAFSRSGGSEVRSFARECFDNHRIAYADLCEQAAEKDDKQGSEIITNGKSKIWQEHIGEPLGKLVNENAYNGDEFDQAGYTRIMKQIAGGLR